VVVAGSERGTRGFGVRKYQDLLVEIASKRSGIDRDGRRQVVMSRTRWKFCRALRSVDSRDFHVATVSKRNNHQTSKYRTGLNGNFKARTGEKKSRVAREKVQKMEPVRRRDKFEEIN
jgi:hypothetical protein